VILRRATVMALLLAGSPFGTSAAAQSLGEAAAKTKARREKEREKKGAPAPRVFTDEDLLKGSPPGSQERTPPRDPDLPEPAKPDERTDEQKAAADDPSRAGGGSEEDQWRSRAREARAPVAAAEQKVKDAEAEVERFKQDLNPMSTTFSQDPYVILRLQGQLTEAEGRAAQAREELEAARKQFEAFETEARRAGAAPGWLRE
jgi:hypothetical protein